MSSPDWTLVVDGLGLPEGPRYAAGHLYVADASAGGVWRVPAAGGDPVAVVEHRRGIAGLALHADGGYVVSGRNLAWKDGARTSVLATVGIASEFARFNDLTVSFSGQVYAGSIDLRPGESVASQPGSLVLVDVDGTVREVARDLAASNGLAFAPDGRTLYHVDSGPRIVRGYDVLPDGSLGPWWEVHRWIVGIPDGMAVAADGSLWVALGEADEHGYVSVLEPDGGERDRIQMPHPGVKSLCFGGPERRTLFVALGGDLEAARRDGFVIRLDVDVAGVPDVLARVRPSDVGER